MRLTVSLFGLLLLFMGVFAVQTWASLAASAPAETNMCGRKPSAATCAAGVAPCASSVFCYGTLLKHMQLSGIFTDSKTFVDSPLKEPPATVLRAFAQLGKTPTAAQLKAFYAKYFDAPGTDLETWTPPDWKAAPPFLNNIHDQTFVSFAEGINNLWRTFGRKVASSVSAAPSQHSLLDVPFPFIVPGGRFREWYYWDTYWIIDGLLISGLEDTVRGMISNLLEMVQRYGHVPNGGRQYYLDRSQPPMLTQMVWRYYEQTKNASFLSFAYGQLDAEYDFWMQNRSLPVKDGETTYNLNHFAAHVGSPRPEGYAEDTADVADITSALDQACLFREIASMAESGWDFSSRWLADKVSLQQSCITTLAPVDLNAIMYANEVTLARIHDILGHQTAAEFYILAAKSRLKAITLFMYNEEEGMWFDYNATASKQVPPAFYASSLVPLWAGAYNRTDAALELNVIKAINRTGLFDWPGGVPTSFFFSGQQWDEPNAWAPLQWFLIQGLQNMGYEHGGSMAEALAQRWLSSNLAVYQEHKVLYEKYSALNFGQPGGGGEYSVVEGFGWTNGVVLSLLNQFPFLTPISH